MTILWWIEGWLVTTCVSYGAYCYKNRGNKIKIMSVRSELRKIRKADEADKKSLF